ncbi:COX15/CtaA family protein [Flavobacterium aciduliphilum]|uniref:Heme A synthase n=1 Tax=Flavobacterium aciduliphilum TaxID=1101402 RepID=A0A328Y9W9_9FLAO|nr:COX15/CtaA family protein [Flavobacterium aciduliphilum]RAR69974.1 cytochrome c oxidase assembly protein subunit 15 [Flavobacterium aciduliphilum]
MNQNKSVIYWLLSGCILIFIMVVVGGITRLTGSGLSMTDWHLVTDTLPPLTESAWQQAFEAYKQFPEYKLINVHNHFQLADYKFIYFWEWFHRFIARILGLVFVIPFIYFLIKKKLDPQTLKKCLILVCLGMLQGAIGWFMVLSGLQKNPDVSHFRLSLHLTWAFIIFAYTLWVALDLIYPQKTKVIFPLRNLSRVTLFFIILQIVYGGFVAGLDAGFIHNHWPLMSDGQFFHDSILLEKNNWISRFTEGKSGVQFVHRTLAYIVFFLILTLFIKSRKHTLSKTQKNGINSLIFIVFVQFLLGVSTLLLHVPIWLGVTHQAGAFFLLASMIFTLHKVTK